MFGVAHGIGQDRTVVDRPRLGGQILVLGHAVDRPAVQGLAVGNYTRRVNACYQPRAIPGSPRIAFIAGAHHAIVGGALAPVDPKRFDLDPQSGEDRYAAIEILTPEVGFPEAPGRPSSYFHSPWPLSEDYFLVAFSMDPLPGWGSRVKEDTATGIYYFDRFGNRVVFPSRRLTRDHRAT
jgi:hypothetical protein